MEEAFKRQASNVEDVLCQNQELVIHLVDLEKLWVAEEQFTMELHGRVEALQDQVCKCGLAGSREVPIEVITSNTSFMLRCVDTINRFWMMNWSTPPIPPCLRSGQCWG